MTTFSLKQDDRLPAIEVTLRDGAGAAVDLSTATGVRFIMRRGTTVKVAAAATIVTAAAGRVKYDWQAGDTDTAGAYRCEWEVIFPTAKPMTFPSDGYDTVVITADLD